MSHALTDAQRKLIHDFALEARVLLTREAREVLEGVYGLYQDGRMEPPQKLPQVQADPETAALYHRLKHFLDDEVKAGLPRQEAAEKLVKETAFTHLNRLVAFKMMEAHRLIRGAVDRGPESNGFKFYLADPEHAEVYELYRQGQTDEAYRHFLLWQCRQVAREINVLFDPDALPGRIFPRPRALHRLLALLNRSELASVWPAEETIGWIYQYFNEQEKADVFERLYKQKQKIRRQDIPAATQLFTPNWIVRFLVQNTLGRLWLQMHPDTQLVDTDLLDYLVPLQGEVPPEPLRPVREITLLDPACGTMHFGLVAFDLFAAMYREELAQAGEPGWPSAPSVAGEDEIPAAIVKHNLFGIDIDLRAVQLSALALYLKAKSLNKKARISDSNLACADVLPLNGARLGTFIKEMRFTRPVYERLIRALWQRLQDVNQLGSLLRLEKELGELIEAERVRYEELPLFAGMPGEFEREAAEEEFWHIIYAQVIQGLDEFARQQAQAGVDQAFFAGEATKGLRLLNVMLSRYDVVVTNPPYSGKRNLNDTVAACLDRDYKDTKGDLYTAFIQRCAEFTGQAGRLGMITQQSFMFLSSYEQLRTNLRAQFAIETMAHTGPRAFAEISGEKVNTTAFVLREAADSPQRENSVGTYFRLVHAPEGYGKRQAFEQALIDSSNTHYIAQHRFDAVPGSPWAYWLNENIRALFEDLRQFIRVAQPRVGLQTGKNERFVRYWWEIGHSRIGFGCSNKLEALSSNKKWFPYMKGGEYRKWFGNQEHLVNWENDGEEIRNFFKPNGRLASRPQNTDYYFHEGITWTDLGAKGFSARINPGGFIFDVSGSCAFPRKSSDITGLLAVMNASSTNYLMSLLNPTLHFQVGDLKRLPIPDVNHLDVSSSVCTCVRIRKLNSTNMETTYDFSVLLSWDTYAQDSVKRTTFLCAKEFEVNEKVLSQYGLSKDDWSMLQPNSVEDDNEIESVTILDENQDEPSDDSSDDSIGHATRWISYAVGIILGRFQPGVRGKLGSAVCRRQDFAIGSLPEPDEAEFDELVGPPERFAYVDEEGGRHVFSAEVEQALRRMTVPDGITVLDEGHPRDLPALVEQALRLMLGDDAAREVIREATGDASGNPRAALRNFLEKDFSTDWHFKWYRSRPVYWPLQSAGRSYGFVLFHERIDKQTLYTLQREYLDHKLNGLRLHVQDLRGRMSGKSGSALKKLERQVDKIGKELEEIEAFARTMARIAHDGYEPEPNWIDDGVILRMAPLWELIPIWKSEPKKYWQRLQAGQYDWSHIAMNYWPERVREACRTNKSYAIAHGHESWYEGE